MEWVKEKMYQARLQRNKSQGGEQTATIDNRVQRDVETADTLFSRLLPSAEKLVWLMGGIAAGITIVIMMWWAVFFFMDDKTSRDYMAGSLPSPFVRLPAQATSIEEIREDLDNLTEQVKALAAAVADLKNKPLDLHAVTDSFSSSDDEPVPTRFQQQKKTPGVAPGLEVLPSIKTGMVSASTSESKDSGKSGDTASRTLSASKEHASTAPGIATQNSIREEAGGWIINLASVPQKESAERFAEKAKSRGVDARLYQVTVRGKDYWRVHMSGFATAKEAKAQASLVEKKLGIKDVWVTRR
mgnify:FL=1